MDPEALRLALDTLPTSPGVYVFKADDGSVLYVGKARSLRSRVRSYFQPNTGDVRFFIARLERELGSLETFVTANEKEAALLENQLIKAERPATTSSSATTRNTSRCASIRRRAGLASRSCASPVATAPTTSGPTIRRPPRGRRSGS